MNFISQHPENAINEILHIVKRKNIKCIPHHTKNGTWYMLGGCLCLENHNKGRSQKGLLTTIVNPKHVYRINDKLNWIEPFGKSNKRFQYNTLGKPIIEIKRMLDIVELVERLNRI